MYSVKKQHIMMSLLIVGLFLALFTGCGRVQVYEELPMDEAWAKVRDKYDKGRYLDAIDRLEIFLINYSGSSYSDSAQYMLAESHYNVKEYIISVSEYQKMMVQYPQSPLVENAEYKLGLSFFKLSPKHTLQQDYTDRALETFQLFIEDFPNSDYTDDALEKIEECRMKLAKKEYNNARLYHKMKEYEAARIYYAFVIADYYDTDLAEDAQYYIANSYAAEKRWEEAISAYNQFMEKYPESKRVEEAVVSINRVKQKMNAEEKKKDNENNILIMPVINGNQ